MQQLLAKISALDPAASLTLRVIACFDELIVGNVNTRGLLSAAASLAGCEAGFRQYSPRRTVRVTPQGELAPTDGIEPSGLVATADGLTVWLEREGEKHANDDMILERLALAVRIRCGQGTADLDNRRDLGLVLDASLPLDQRTVAASRLGLHNTTQHRVVAAPLFALWASRPGGPEDVVATPFGSMHAVVVSASCEKVDATSAGVGVATDVEHLPHSFRTAVVALRLCSPPETYCVNADEYGGLIGLLADAPSDSHVPDADLLDELMKHHWACPTLDVLIRAGSLRQAARLGGVHHSTMQSRVDTIAEMVGFDPLDGLGRTRLGIAYLVWRLRHSRVLELPAPTANSVSA